MSISRPTNRMMCRKDVFYGDQVCWRRSVISKLKCYGLVDWLCVCVQSLGSLVAFQAMVSIATIGLYISYALPILFRITIGRSSFRPGPFNLGRYSLFVGWVAVLWVVTITVLFCLPVIYPVTESTLNYTPVAVGGVFVLIMFSWLVSARKWFKGPQFNIDTSLQGDKNGNVWFVYIANLATFFIYFITPNF